MTHPRITSIGLPGHANSNQRRSRASVSLSKNGLTRWLRISWMQQASRLSNVNTWRLLQVFLPSNPILRWLPSTRSGFQPDTHRYCPPMVAHLMVLLPTWVRVKTTTVTMAGTLQPHLPRPTPPWDTVELEPCGPIHLVGRPPAPSESPLRLQGRRLESKWPTTGL